jgi:hypothetical protein
MTWVLISQWGMITIPFLAAAIWLLNEACQTARYASRLRKMGYPFSGRVFSLKRAWLAFKIMRFAGSAWFIRRTYLSLIIISFITLLIAGLRVHVTAHSLEIARAGALVTIAGLLSVLLGLWEARTIRQIWDAIAVIAANSKGIVADLKSRAADDAQRYSTRLSVYFSIAGTIIWAYGDQVAACGVLPLVPMKDQSGVTCFTKEAPLFPNGPDLGAIYPRTAISKL